MTDKPTVRISPIKRLKNLPEVFNIQTLANHLGDGPAALDKTKARVYLTRWASQGLIESLGGHTGIYFNLMKDPRGRGAHEAQAIRMLYPDAILIGANVLHDAGWTTQTPRRLHLAITPRARYHNLDDMDFFARPKSWYQAMAPFMGEAAADSLPRLSPAAALVDGWWARQVAKGRTHIETWSPDPDDIEMDEVDWVAVDQVAKAMNIRPPDWAREMIGDEQGGKPDILTAKPRTKDN